MQAGASVLSGRSVQVGRHALPADGDRGLAPETLHPGLASGFHGHFNVLLLKERHSRPVPGWQG